MLFNEESECDSEDIPKYGQKTVKECAIACKNISSMFVFDNSCFSICGCYCEIGADANGNCSTKYSEYLNLYKYVGGK